MDKIKEKLENEVYFFSYFPENYSRRVCKSTNKIILAVTFKLFITYMPSVARCLQFNQSIHIIPFFVYRKYNVFRNTKGLDDAVQMHKIMSNFSADCIKMHATITV